MLSTIWFLCWRHVRGEPATIHCGNELPNMISALLLHGCGKYTKALFWFCNTKQTTLWFWNFTQNSNWTQSRLQQVRSQRDLGAKAIIIHKYTQVGVVLMGCNWNYCTGTSTRTWFQHVGKQQFQYFWQKGNLMTNKLPDSHVSHCRT